MRLIKYTFATISGFGFLALLGSAGACDAGTISLGQSIIQSIIGLSVFILGGLAAMFFDGLDKASKRKEG